MHKQDLNTPANIVVFITILDFTPLNLFDMNYILWIVPRPTTIVLLILLLVIFSDHALNQRLSYSYINKYYHFYSTTFLDMSSLVRSGHEQ